MTTKTFITAIAILLFTKSIDAQSWFQIQTGTTKKLNTIDFPSANVGYIGGNDSLLLKTTDGGKNWTPLNYTGVTFYPGGEHIINLKFVTETIGFMAVGPYSGSYKTIDGGLTWTGLSNLTTCYNQGLFFFDENNGFVGGSGCFQGEKIERLASNIWNSANINTPTWDANNRIVDIDFSNTNFGLAASRSGYVLRTTDGGNNWDTIPTPGAPMNPLTSIIIINNNLAYAGYESQNVGFGLYKSVDNGLTWYEDFNSATFLYPDFLTLHQSGNNKIYSGGRSQSMTSGAIFESPNDTSIWNYSIVDEYINDISSYNDSIIFAVGDSGYLISTKDFSIPQGISFLADNKFGVFPNPAKLSLTVNAKGFENGQLKIFNMTGALMQQENFKSMIDISNLPKGLYIIEIKSENKNMHTKFVKE